MGSLRRHRSTVAVPFREDATRNLSSGLCLPRHGGLYGVLYLEVARVPERGWVLAAVGLTGKVFGPIGLARLIWSGVWPVRTGILCVTNDLIW